MKANFVKIILLIVFFICSFYFFEIQYIHARQTINFHKEKMSAIQEQIAAKQNEITKAHETLDIINLQNAKKNELYENLEKWNAEILTYIN